MMFEMAPRFRGASSLIKALDQEPGGMRKV